MVNLIISSNRLSGSNKEEVSFRA